VPWNELVGPPNKGHAAIADFLISRAAKATLSANFDCLIESWAEEHKVALQGALTGQEAATFSSDANPLIKFHGCFHRCKDETFWTDKQLTDPVIQQRVVSCSQWMNLHLGEQSLVVVGFWTDWGYLNDVITDALQINNASSVTVIDRSSLGELQTKAPNLWARLNSLSHQFEHVQASSDDALDELRTAYSKSWARKFYALGHPLAQDAGAAIPTAGTPEALNGEDLYNLRRDAQGTPYTRAATLKIPAPDAAQAAFAHLIFLNAGATQRGAWLQHSGRSVRIVNGAGQGLGQVQAQYKEPPSVLQSEIVVCAGASDFGVPARLIAVGRGASTIRPTPGGVARWLTLGEAQVEFGL
jgi:hypothetical protein